jgi:hypothetical protein
MKIYYKSSNASYMFRSLMWPSSGQCFMKNKYIDMLQKFLKQYTCKILDIKINSLSSII